MAQADPKKILEARDGLVTFLSRLKDDTLGLVRYDYQGDAQSAAEEQAALLKTLEYIKSLLGEILTSQVEQIDLEGVAKPFMQ